MTFFKTYKRTLFFTAILALFAVSAVYWSGCSGKKNPANPDGGDIVCKEDEVWVEEGKESGFIFTSESDVIAAAAISGGRWYGEKVGTYSTSGDKLTLILNNGKSDTMTYKVSGGKLTLSGGGETIVFTKRTGVHINA